MPRRSVRSLRHRHGGVRRLFWPAGDPTVSATPLEEHPPGYFTSVRWGVLVRLVLVYGLLLFAVVVAVALVGSVL